MATNRAGDIMISLDKYPHIPHWFSLRQGVAELEKSTIEFKGRSSLPRAVLVFAVIYSLLGDLRSRDILGALEPNFLHDMHVADQRRVYDVDVDPDLVEVSSGKITRAIREHSEIPISNVMIPIQSTVDFEDHLFKVIHIMIRDDLNLIPVLKEGKVVGVVRSVDVFHEVANILL